MLKKLAFLTLGLIAMPQIGWAAPCSRINLTKCLDSACAINLSANPAARCQYCGTPDAGTPAASGMKNLTAGTSSKNTISAKELKDAPTDPGKRYMWATELCLEKVANCTPDDVTETYDELIEKSCTAAGINNNATNLQKKSTKSTKTVATCTNEISICVTKPEKCDNDFSKCSENEKFTNFFASCAAQASGCTNFINQARSEIDATRKSALSGAKSALVSIIATHRQTRLNNLAKANSGCLHDTDYENCKKNICKNNTANNCATDNEKEIAKNLCQFYKTACSKISVQSERELQKSLDELMQEVQRELNL